jgi:putative endonuclease
VRGFAGEQAAMRMLSAAGWVIEAHRFRAGRHDIDLVIRRGDLVAFVEVKTRASRAFGPPELAIGWRKRRALAWAGSVWAARFGKPWFRYRFDLVAVLLGPQGPSMRHLPDAWRP